jgi:hypothetical protein
MEQNTCTFVRLTTSGVVGDSGQPVDIAGYSVLSGATAAQPWFVNGTSTAGTYAFAAGPITISQANTVSIPSPVRFPKGCFVSFDANTTSVSVFYVQALTA